MRVWRISRSGTTALDGEGARIYGGRWNRQGTAVVYASQSLALAALEFFVNLDKDVEIREYVATAIDIGDEERIDRVLRSELPKGWRGYPGPAAIQDLGTDWATKLQSPVLAVPSVIIPSESNYLLNPAHPNFRRFRIRKPEPFDFDVRMWK